MLSKHIKPTASPALATVRALIEEWKDAVARVDAGCAAARALEDGGANFEAVRAADERVNAITGEVIELEERICRIGLDAFGRSPREVDRSDHGVALAIDGRIFLVKAKSDPGEWYCDVIPPDDYLVLE